MASASWMLLAALAECTATLMSTSWQQRSPVLYAIMCVPCRYPTARWPITPPAARCCCGHRCARHLCMAAARDKCTSALCSLLTPSRWRRRLSCAAAACYYSTRRRERASAPHRDNTQEPHSNSCKQESMQNTLSVASDMRRAHTPHSSATLHQ